VKQLAFMIVATFFGTAGVYLISPFCGVFVYYLFAVLRPQFLWEWSLPQGVGWSYYVALATIGAAVAGFLFGNVHSGQSGQPGQSSPRPRSSNLHVPLLVFGFWIVVTCLTARHFDATWEGFIEYLKIFVMFVVAATLITTTRQVLALFTMIGLSLGFIAYEINFYYLFQGYLGIHDRGYGGLDNNGAGLLLAMGMPVCWYAFESTTRWWRWFYLPLIPLIVHAVMLTYSRGAMLSLIVVCPLIWWRSRQKVWLTLVLAAFVFVVVPILAGPQIRARFMTIEKHELDESANSRKQSWAAAWKMALDYPIFGVGVGNARLFSHQYGADYEGRMIHNQYLQVAADNGFVGLTLFLTMLWCALRALRRCRRFVAGQDDPESRRIAAIASGVECSLIVYCTGAIFLSLDTFELFYLLILLSFQLAVMTGANDKTGLGAAAVRRAPLRGAFRPVEAICTAR
jgi:probable O-glycosylation ligase (exosortase A-associated)